MECGLPFVAFLDPDVVKTPSDVEFREEPGSLQTVNKVVDQREQVKTYIEQKWLTGDSITTTASYQHVWCLSMNYTDTPMAPT
jgi:hypothetical protein